MQYLTSLYNLGNIWRLPLQPPKLFESGDLLGKEVWKAGVKTGFATAVQSPRLLRFLLILFLWMGEFQCDSWRSCFGSVGLRLLQLNIMQSFMMSSKCWISALKMSQAGWVYSEHQDERNEDWIREEGVVLYSDRPWQCYLMRMVILWVASRLFALYLLEFGSTKYSGYHAVIRCEWPPCGLP